jgi:hypothetical protein
VRVAVAVVAVALAAWVLATQPFVGNGEVSLRYLDAIQADQAMVDYLDAHHPGATVLTEWPQKVEYENPLLGYVDRPFRVKGYARPADLAGADLILVSSAMSNRAELEELAADHDWSAVRTVRRGGAEVVLYAPPGAD